MRRSLIIPLLFLLVSCTDEREVFFVNDVDLKTTVSDITTDGVLFTAEIKTIKSAITDRGFVWRLGNFLDYATAEKKSVGPGDGTDNFSVAINSTLLKDFSYVVSAYIVANGITTYGEVVTFKSKGSLGPTISDFSPKIAKATETVSISGSGFSIVAANNIVRLNQTIVIPNFTSSNLIKFDVPKDLVETTFTVSVTTAGRTSTASPLFQLNPASPYQILSVDKGSVGICDELELITAGIPAGTNITISYNGVNASPFFRDGNILKVKTPSLPTNTTTITLKLIVGQLQSTYSNSISFLKPQINSFSGALTSGSSVSVIAQNLPVCGLTAKINGVAINLTNVTPIHFDFVVPSGVGASFNMNFFLTGNGTSFMSYNFH